MWGFSSPPLLAGPAIGVIDTPAEMSSVAGEVAFTGWAIDNSGILGVDIYRSSVVGEAGYPTARVFVGTATQINGARPDVAGSFPLYPGVTQAGWGFMVLSNFLPNGGNGTFTLHAVVAVGKRREYRDRVQDNCRRERHESVPVRHHRYTGQGATVSGFVTNFGWALTPQPKLIPTDGSTIDVYIDGTMVGHPSYGHYRPDIATLFPGYANSNGAVGFYQFDSTTMSNGLHTISWVVRDNAGAVQGVGSRFFRALNP